MSFLRSECAKPWTSAACVCILEAEISCGRKHFDEQRQVKRMAEFTITLNILLPVFLQMGLGQLLRRVGWLPIDLARRINRLIFRFFLPILVFNNMRGMSGGSGLDGSYAVFVFIAMTAVFAVAMLFVRRLEKDPLKRGVIVQGIFRANLAVLGIPLMQGMYGTLGAEMIAVTLPLVLPINNVLSVVALSAWSKAQPRPRDILKSIMTNPLILACVAGGVFMLTGWQLPALLDKVATQVGNVATPLALIVLGASLEWKGLRDSRRELFWTVLLRQAVIPAIMVTAAYFLGFRGVYLGVIVVLFGAPNAVSSYPMADAMGCDGTLAASMVVLTTVFSMGTLFALIYVGKLLAVL